MARKIKIINKTQWQTRHLRAFAVRAANMVLDPNEKKYLSVEVTYNKQGGRSPGCSGWAPYNGNFIRVMLPSPGKDHPKPDRVDFAHVLGHEIGHAKGLTHQDMRGSSFYQRVGSWREHYAWAKDLPLDPVPPKAKKQIAPADRATQSLATVQRRIKQWETRLKRAQTALKKYRAKEKYYTKRASALASKLPSAASTSTDSAGA